MNQTTSKRAPEIVRKIAASEDSPLVTDLALAYLAQAGDPALQDKIKQSLENRQTQWPMVRALRVVPLPFTVDALCRLVDRVEYTDETYSAIVALGRVPHTWAQSPRAAQVLSAAVVSMEGTPWKDGMRTAAIAALGNLKVESHGPLLIKQLGDDNPAVVREAARSTERILGLQTMVQRMVEAATRAGNATTVEALGRALGWLNREAVAEELERLMISGSILQQEMSRTLLSELGGAAAQEKLHARTSAMKQYAQVLERAEDRVQDLFEKTVHEAQRGFQVATLMDLIVFAAGMILLLASAANALLRTGDFATWAGVGGVGVAGVLYGLLISNPRKQVRDAVDHLMKVKIVFLAYLRRLHQTDQAYTRLLLENDKITAETLKSYSDIVGATMETTMNQLSTGVTTKTNVPAG
jgi:hypothetical protein